MEYRKLSHREEQLSVLGLGTSSIGAAGDRKIEATMHMALEPGVNLSLSTCISYFGIVLLAKVPQNTEIRRKRK